MNVPRCLASVLALTAVAVVSGCAAAYEAYPCGCVPYGYCPPPPLPWTEYAGCPTPAMTRIAPATVTVDVAPPVE